MVTTEELKQLLLDADYTQLPHHIDDDTEELWEDPAGHTMIFKEACKLIDRCTCCGETGVDSPSAACSARHEGKDCNCFPQKQTKNTDCDNTAGSNAS